MAWSRLDLGVGLVALGGIDLIWPEIADLVDVVEVEPQTDQQVAVSGFQMIPDTYLTGQQARLRH